MDLTRKTGESTNILTRIIGKPGEQGIKGLQGRKGDKGEKGESPISVVSQSNWKQCVWKSSDGRDSGKIKV